MKDIDIIDQFLDDREFRNYIASNLTKLGYTEISIEDERISDSTKKNDNDLLAKKGDYTYTVQTFLNKEIKESHIKETIKDMEKEHVSFGIIVTNTEVSKEIKQKAKENGIEIIDRNKEFFDFLVATDQLDDFLGYKEEVEEVEDEDEEEEDLEENEE